MPQVLTDAHKGARKTKAYLSHFYSTGGDVSCHKLSLGLKLGSTILNPYPSGSQWNVTM
jgi:hypothetical protein